MNRCAEGAEKMKSLRMFPLLCLLVVTACNSAATPAPDSGIEGQALIGPTCPVVQVGQECPDQPYQATVTVLNDKGKQVTQFETDAEGRFRVPLEPGTYTLRPASPSVMPSAPEQTVTVTAGQFTQVLIQYDSGIR